MAGEETGLIKPDKGRVADPIGAFQRWAREFMDGTADLEEGLRLARARRAVMARLIRDNPHQAIANRVDDDTREALPEAIRAQLEEPIHGTAPDIAGKGIANPTGSILSVALLVRYSLGLTEEGAAIERAVDKVLEQNARTADIVTEGTERVSTVEMGDLIVAAIEGGN